MEVSRARSPYLKLAQHVSQLSRALERIVDPVLQERFGITGRHLVAVRAIELGESNPMRIAERASLPPSSASRMLDGLVEMGLLVRREDPSDRRKSLLAITPRGERVAREAREVIEETLRSAYADVPLPEVERAAQALAGLAARFSSEPGSPEAEREELQRG